jgi:hypothetical protein
MTDLEIDRALALAIEWREDQMRVLGGTLWLKTNDFPHMSNGPPMIPWRMFSHKKPAVIWPIAERYNAFPVLFDGDPNWYSNCWVEDQRRLREAWSDNACTAVALAVIRSKKEQA